MARKFRRNGHFTRRVAAASKSTFNREILIDLQFAIVSTANISYRNTMDRIVGYFYASSIAVGFNKIVCHPRDTATPDFQSNRDQL